MTRWASRHPSETQICIGIMDFVYRSEGLYPEFKWIFHAPNEAKRHPVTQKRLKAMGMRAGILDYKWDLARGGYHGFAMEVKDRKGTTSDDQDAYMDYLIAQGYYVCLVRTVDAGIKEIMDYYQGRTVRDVTKPTRKWPAGILPSVKQLPLMPGQIARMGGKLFVRG